MFKVFVVVIHVLLNVTVDLSARNMLILCVMPLWIRVLKCISLIVYTLFFGTTNTQNYSDLLWAILL